MLSVGIDVSKSKLSCAFQDEVREFANSRSGFVELAKWAHGAVVWCMEATGRYHEELAMFVYSQGLRCVVVNPGAAKKYLDFVKSRSKTDRVDALGLARLGELEGEHLRPFRPVPT